MRIKSIQLENIRSYKHELIEFKQGINFLSGDIGSGKSSILQAIEFALFGFKRGDLEGFQLLRKGENSGSIKLVIINSKNNSQIEIFRSLKKSKSTDTISQDVGYIKYDDNLIELTPQELNSQVFDLLNFPKEFITKDKNLIYRFTIYTPQEQLKEIIFESPDKRLEVIRKIFGIDKYKQLQEAIFIYNTKIREDKKVFQVKIEPKQKFQEEIKIYEKELIQDNEKLNLILEKEKSAKDNINKHKIAIQKRESFLEKLTSNLLILEKNRSKIENCEHNIKKLNNQKKEIEINLKNFDEKKIKHEQKTLNNEIEKYNSELKKLEQDKLKLDSIKKDYDILLKQKQELNKNIIELKNKKQNYDELKKSFDYMLTKCQVKDLENYISNDKKIIVKLSKLKIEKDELEKSLIKDNLEKERLEQIILDNKNKIRNISNIEKCDNCYQDIDKSHKDKIKLELEKHIDKSKHDLEKFSLNIKKSQKEKIILDKDLIQLSQIKDDLIKKEEKLLHLLDKEKKESILSEKLKVLEQDLSTNLEFETKEKQLDNKIKNTTIILEDYDMINQKEIKINNLISNNKLKIIELENLVKHGKNYEQDIKKIEQQIKENNDLIDKKDSILIKLKHNSEKEKLIKTQKIKLNSNLDKLYENQTIISQKLSSYKTQIENKQKYIDDKKKELQQISTLEKDYQKLLYNELFLNEKVSNITRLIERSVFTKYYTEFNEEFESLFRDLIEDNDIEVRLDENFSPVIEQNGYDVDIKNLSGGEKSSLAVAYRLGLKKIIESNLESKQKLSLLILDEPTDGFSNEQIDRLGNILKASPLKQIILVSHDEKIESIADNVLKVEKVNHKSSVK